MKSIAMLVMLSTSLLWARPSDAVTITINWSFPSPPDLAGYRIHYSPTSGAPYSGVLANEGPSPVEIPLSALADVANPSTSISGLPSCNRYYFAISAFYLDGHNSLLSPEWERMLIPLPKLIEVAPGLSEGVLSVSWKGLAVDDSGSLDQYRVHYSLDSGEPYLGSGADNGDSPVHVSASEFSLPLTGLEPGATVYVMVEAVCPDGTTSGSTEDSGLVAAPACDNHVIEQGETCDPLDTCPVDCDDGNACTSDSLLGDPDQCTATCDHSPIMTCTGGDGCCPIGCDNNSDSDCSVSCDNDIIEQGETCDPPGTCPTTCDDGVACTADALIGSAESCSAACSYSPITHCDSGDGCCPPSCNHASDSDCSVSCGNGLIEQGETCDPPSSCIAACDDGVACTNDTLIGSPANCSSSCGHAPITECDSGDGCCPPGCDNTIDEDCSVSCDNNVIEYGETCDPPGTCPTTCDDLVACTVDIMTGSAESCSVNCSFNIITECDHDDGCCPPGCTPATDSDCSSSCGDGFEDTGETCDPPDTCPVNCNDGNVCTRGILSGNAESCSAACSFSPITECNPGDGCCPPGCTPATDGDCQAGSQEPAPQAKTPGAAPRVLQGGCSTTPRPANGSALLFLLGAASMLGGLRRCGRSRSQGEER